jgi:hypothetical protein
MTYIASYKIISLSKEDTWAAHLTLNNETNTKTDTTETFNPGARGFAMHFGFDEEMDKSIGEWKVEYV